MAPTLDKAPSASSKRKRAVSEADLPLLPPRLCRNASASEKAARALIMKERRRLQMQLQEQMRAKRDRNDRTRSHDSERRATQRLLNEARSYPLPQITPRMFESLWSASPIAGMCPQAPWALKPTWREVLQRPLSESASYSREYDNETDERVVRVGGQVCYAEVRGNNDVFELRDGTFDKNGYLRNGIIYEFDYRCWCNDDELDELQDTAACTIQAAMRNKFLLCGPRRLPAPKGCPPQGCLCRRCMLAPLELQEPSEAQLQGEACKHKSCAFGLMRIQVVHTPGAPHADRASSNASSNLSTDELLLDIQSHRLDGSSVIHNHQPITWAWKRKRSNSAGSDLKITPAEKFQPGFATSWCLSECAEVPNDMYHQIVSGVVAAV